ncbi:MAG: hypothetical protein JW395_2420 [Nitrospira sp.]|nr:hypothetical protein [Nitrospira sp.]
MCSDLHTPIQGLVESLQFLLVHAALFLRLLSGRDIPYERAERVGPPLPHGRRDRQLYRNLVPVPVAAGDFNPGVQHRPLAGCEEAPQSSFMGLPVLWRDNGGGEESPDCLLPRPTEYPFGLGVPVGDDTSRIHPDETIERHLDDAPRVSLALAQRRFGLPGERMFLLCVPIFPLHAGHSPDQESKRGNHHGAAGQTKVPENFSNRRQHVAPIHTHEHCPTHALKLA